MQLVLKGFLDPRGLLRVPLMSAYVRPYARPQQKFLLLQFHLFLPPPKATAFPTRGRGHGHSDNVSHCELADLSSSI